MHHLTHSSHNSAVGPIQFCWTSLETLGTRLEFKMRFSMFGQGLAAQHVL